MFSLPYQTTICSMYTKLDQVLSKVRRAALDLEFPVVKTPANYTLNNAHFVTPRQEHEAIPTFSQYINIGEPNQPNLLIDSRQYMKYDIKTGLYKINGVNDWSFECIRMALNLQLLKADETIFSRLGDLPAKVFHKWVSGALITKYNLPIESQMALYVITAYYFYAMCNYELQPADKTARTQFAPIISRITGVPPDFVLNTIDQVGPLMNATDLAYAMSMHSNQSRTGELKFSDLYLLLANSWQNGAPNARENVGVALEHMPTFIAMVYMGIADRSYRRTVITQRAESLARGNDLKIFTDLVFRLVNNQYVEQ